VGVSTEVQLYLKAVSSIFEFTREGVDELMFVAHLRDGRTLKESEGTDWRQVPHQDITSLQLYRSGKTYTISADGKNVEFIQLKRAVVGTGPLKGITERVIGFILDGTYAFKIEVDEGNGNVKVTIEKREGKRWRRL